MVRLCDYGAGNDILCATSGWNCDMGKDSFAKKELVFIRNILKF